MPTNTLITSSILSKETLIILENNLVAANKVHRTFKNEFTKIGSTLSIRKPVKFTVTDGATLALQDVQEPTTSITINTQKHVGFQFTSQELTLVIEEFKERYLKSIGCELANAVDYDVIANWPNVYNVVGTRGTVPAGFAALAAVGQRMDEEAVPQDGRTLLLTPAAYWNLATGMSAVFVQPVAEPALKGALVNLANLEIYVDQNTQFETVGALGGTPVVDGGAQTGSSLATSGWTASVANLLRPGNVFTIAGVFAVNPKNRQTTGVLRQFVVTAAVSSDAGGFATIPIYPAITPTGAYQTVTASPLNGAAITVSGTAGVQYGQNLAFTKDAFGLVIVPLEVPQGADFAARDLYKNISLRVWRDSDIVNDAFPTRVDVLYGTATWYPELAVRLTN